jgi:AraC-like DNA-binding protein
VRIWVAGQRLLEGEPHKVVASELNFKDIAHFYHQFRRYHGMTPTGFVDKVYLGLDDSRFLPDGTLAVKQVDDEGVRDALGRLTQPLRAGRPAKVSAGEAVSPPADSFRP